jgi:hypothetical protein
MDCYTKAGELAEAKEHVRLSYNPYYFSEKTVFFLSQQICQQYFLSDLSAKRTRPSLPVLQGTIVSKTGSF